MDDKVSSAPPSAGKQHSSSSSNSPPSPKRPTLPPSGSGVPPSIVNLQPPPSAAASTVPASSSTGQSRQELPRRSQLSVYSAVKEQIIRSARRRPLYPTLYNIADPFFTGEFPPEPVRPFQRSLRFFNGYFKPSLLPELPPPRDFDELVQEVDILHTRVQELIKGIELERKRERSVMERRAAKGRKQGLEELLFNPPPNDDRINALVQERNFFEDRIKEVLRELDWRMYHEEPSISGDPSTGNKTKNDNERLSSDIENQKVADDAPGAN